MFAPPYASYMSVRHNAAILQKNKSKNQAEKFLLGEVFVGDSASRHLPLLSTSMDYSGLFATVQPIEGVLDIA